MAGKWNRSRCKMIRKWNHPSTKKQMINYSSSTSYVMMIWWLGDIPILLFDVVLCFSVDICHHILCLIIHLCLNFYTGLAKLPLRLRHVYSITLHRFILIWFLSHVTNAMLLISVGKIRPWGHSKYDSNIRYIPQRVHTVLLCFVLILPDLLINLIILFGIRSDFKTSTSSETYSRQDLFPSYLFFRRQFHAIVIFRMKSISDLDSGSLPRLFGEFIYAKLKIVVSLQDWTWNCQNYAHQWIGLGFAWG